MLLMTLLALTSDLPPQPRDAADLVITGAITKIVETPRKWAEDGEKTTFTATVKVEKVEKGKGAKAGDVLEVTWEAVTKLPTMPPLKYAHGQAHPVKARDRVRMWVVQPAKGPLVVIYNKDGVEKLK
jgi:hypothetical protein